MTELLSYAFETAERERPIRDGEHEPVHEYGRMRVYAFLFLVAVSMFAYISYAVEGEELITSFDDLAVVGVGAIAHLVIAIRWRKPSLLRLARVNNVLFILGLWMVVFTIFAFEVEAGFPEELVDEVPKLILSLLLIVNRFV